MGLTVMAAAQRHDELVADLAPDCAVLREAQMMGISRPAPADQTLFGHEPHMISVTNAAWLGIGQMGLIDACGRQLADRSLCLFGFGGGPDRTRWESIGLVRCLLHNR